MCVAKRVEVVVLAQSLIGVSGTKATARPKDTQISLLGDLSLIVAPRGDVHVNGNGSPTLLLPKHLLIEPDTLWHKSFPLDTC